MCVHKIHIHTHTHTHIQTKYIHIKTLGRNLINIFSKKKQLENKSLLLLIINKQI
jgi:hypothetical protein